MLGHYLRNVIRHGCIDPVEYYVSHRYCVVYVENPKVACTAIKQVLFPDLDHATLGQDEFHARVRRHALFVPPQGASVSYTHFSFFRSPLDRLESCFRDKIERVSNAPERSIFHLRSQRFLFRLFGGLDLAQPDVEFANFVEAVVRIPDSLRDRHIRSQHAVLRGVLHGATHFIGRQESLDADWTRLSKLTGLPPLPALNQTRKQNGRNTALPQPILARFHKSFRDDYRLLGYPLEEAAT